MKKSVLIIIIQQYLMDFSKNARVYTSFTSTLLISCVRKSIKSISSKTKWHVRRFFNNRPSVEPARNQTSLQFRTLLRIYFYTETQFLCYVQGRDLVQVWYVAPNLLLLPDCIWILTATSGSGLLALYHRCRLIMAVL